MKQRWHLELAKLSTILVLAALVPALFMPAASAQGYAGPSASGEESAPGQVNSGGAGADYSHGAPNFWGNRGGFNSAGLPNVSQPPAVGFDMGHSGYVNGGNNGGQSAVQLPASNCCGKATRNSAYYASKYASYNLFPTGDAPGQNANYSVPGLNTAGSGANYMSNPANAFANSRMMMQMRSTGAAGHGGNGTTGQMVPGQVSVPGQMPGSI